ELLTDQQRQKLDALRSALGRVPDVRIDTGYRHTVRACLVNARGGRRPLPLELATDVLRGQGLVGEVRLVGGASQTDFVLRDTDKATGIRVLLQACGGGPAGDEERPLALAVG